MINGPRKGGHPDTVKWLRETPSFKALYQLHRNVQTTINFYCGLETTQATAVFGKLMREKIRFDDD